MALQRDKLFPADGVVERTRDARASRAKKGGCCRWWSRREHLPAHVDADAFYQSHKALIGQSMHLA
jgi:hypothetical protein